MTAVEESTPKLQVDRLRKGETMMNEDFPAVGREVEFWGKVIEGDRLVEAIAANRRAATVFFGEAPTNRGDPTELTQIALARRILLMSDEAVADELIQMDRIIDLLIESGVVEEERAKYGDGVEAVKCSGDKGDPLQDLSASSIKFSSIWQVAAQEVRSEGGSFQSEPELLRRAAQRLLDKALEQ